MTNFVAITAQVKRNGNLWYPHHVRVDAARKTMSGAMWYLLDRVSPNHDDVKDLLEAANLLETLRLDIAA